MTVPQSVSVIVPTIGRPESLEQLLCSISKQTVRPAEVVVADGSSEPETERLLADPRWVAAGLVLRRVVVQPPHAVRQREAAVARSIGDLLFFLDDDIELESDCIEQMVSCLTKQPGAVAVMGTFTNMSWPQPTRAWRLYLQWVLGLKPDEWQGRVLGPLLRFGFDPLPTVVRRCDWIGTCNSLVRRVAYQAVGGFSDFFLHRCTMNEDVDLGIKLTRVGRILFCPMGRMAHYHAPSGRVPPAQVAEDDLHNRYLILRRTCGLVRSQALSQVFLFALVESLSALLGGVRRKRFNSFWQQLFGRVAGLRRVVELGLSTTTKAM